MNYSFWKVLRGRWDKHDFYAWLFGGLLIALIKFFTCTLTITKVSTGAVIALTSIQKFLLIWLVGGILMTFMYSIVLIVSILISLMVIYGAKKGHPGYHQLYLDHLKN